MLTPNYECAGDTCSDTLIASLVMFFIYVENRTSIIVLLIYLNSLMT